MSETHLPQTTLTAIKSSIEERGSPQLSSRQLRWCGAQHAQLPYQGRISQKIARYLFNQFTAMQVSFFGYMGHQ